MSLKGNGFLIPEVINEKLTKGLEGLFFGAKVLVLIPDHTRSLPLPRLFKMVVEVLHNTKQLDFMVALGTHPPLSKASLLKLVGISAEEFNKKYAHIGLLNHAWDDPIALQSIGVVTQAEIQEIAGDRWHPSLGGDVAIRINKAVFEYDHILILGPTFPHEVVGFSGGAKYLFPGISGPEMINVTHWLGALAGVVNTIGVKNTPVRAMIHAAAEKLSVPITLVALVVEGDNLAGLFIGDHVEAWSAAADLSALRHIHWVEQPYQKVLSCAPPMYDELWTAGKAMYKLEPVLAKGGDLTIYAPHLNEVSRVHGKFIYEVGYHVLEYFLKQWDKFSHIPLGVLAHSTHVKGGGLYENSVEIPHAKVSLATKISPEDCEKLSLGYVDPDNIDLETWGNREEEGVLLIPKAGEMLYRVGPSKNGHE